MFELQALKPSTVILGSIWGQSGVNLGQPGVNLHRLTMRMDPASFLASVFALTMM